MTEATSQLLSALPLNDVQQVPQGSRMEYGKCFRHLLGFGQALPLLHAVGDDYGAMTAKLAMRRCWRRMVILTGHHVAEAHEQALDAALGVANTRNRLNRATE